MYIRCVRVSRRFTKVKEKEARESLHLFTTAVLDLRGTLSLIARSKNVHRYIYVCVCACVYCAFYIFHILKASRLRQSILQSRYRDGGCKLRVHRYLPCTFLFHNGICFEWIFLPRTLAPKNSRHGRNLTLNVTLRSARDAPRWTTNKIRIFLVSIFAKLLCIRSKSQRRSLSTIKHVRGVGERQGQGAHTSPSSRGTRLRPDATEKKIFYHCCSVMDYNQIDGSMLHNELVRLKNINYFAALVCWWTVHLF